MLNPEHPGEYCFPPLASMITAAARLMLALLERCVTDLGGTYAMEDTDSMAIVATRRGGLIECPGGPYRKNGKPAIRALSWAQVDAIARAFRALNPYDRAAIPGSILKIEDDNFDPKTGQQRQLWCLAISAKRYALFVRDPDGEPALLRKGINNKEDRYSEHGLGHLLNPTDPESDDRGWIAQAWLAIVRRSLGLPTKPLGFEKRVAVGRITVSSPKVMRPLTALNAGKPYAEQIKPFNFILSCHVAKLGHPIGADPERFHLIAPYETDPRQWEKVQWIDQYSGEAVSDHGLRAARIADRRARQELWRRAARVRVPSRSQVRRRRRRPVLEANHWAARPASRRDRFGHVHRQGVEQARRGRGAKPLRSQRRLHRVSRSAARRVGDEDSAQAQGYAAARAHGANRAAAIDASGDSGGAEAASTNPALVRVPRKAKRLATATIFR